MHNGSLRLLLYLVVMLLGLAFLILGYGCASTGPIQTTIGGKPAIIKGNRICILMESECSEGMCNDLIICSFPYEEEKKNAI